MILSGGSSQGVYLCQFAWELLRGTTSESHFTGGDERWWQPMRDEGGVGWVIWGWFEWAGKQLSSWWCLVLLVFELLWALVKFRFQSHRLGDFGFIESSFTVVETLTTNARGQQFQATLHLEDLKWMNYKWITYLKSNVWTKLRETFGVHWSMLCPSLQSFQSLHYLLRNRRLFEHTACNAFFFGKMP